MNLVVNGKKIKFEGDNVKNLIEHYKLKPESIVVERNGEIVHRDNYQSQQLSEGDIIELVRFVGGG